MIERIVSRSRSLDEIAGRELYLKCENLQRMGAFKFRGAYNAVARLSATERARGVLTYSSGNHAQAVARAARLLATHAVICMPREAPRVKIEGVRADGAEIMFTGMDSEERHELALRLVEQRGLVMVEPSLRVSRPP